MTSLETLDPEALRRHQWARLEALAHVAMPANPFLSARWRRAGLAEARDLRDWDDFRRLPLTRKSELVEDQAAHPPFGTNLSHPFGLFVGFWAGFEGARALGALAIPGGGQDTAQRLAAMESLGATAVCCTPSYALHLAEAARERGIALERLGVRTTVHAGEPGAGIPAVRARIEAAWGARAYDHAGMTEMGAYGFECAAQAGLHVNEAEFIAEVIDPATGGPADEGELVLSNLGRLGSPLLRYRTGDRVRVARTP